MSILIKNATLICPDGPVQADLRTEGGKIAEIGPGLPIGDSRVIDAAGKLVFPGFIDTHTHFEMNKGLPNETADDWASGTLAALAGGTTTVLDFAEPGRGAFAARGGGEANARREELLRQFDASARELCFLGMTPEELAERIERAAETRKGEEA